MRKSTEEEIAKEAPEEAPEKVSEKEQGSLPRSLISLVLTIAVIVGGYVCIRNYVISTYEVPTTSMMETIQVGDRFFADRIFFHAGLNPGDIVCFIKPDCAREEDGSYVEETYIKRVIAVEGQTIELVDGYVYVDGVALDEPYVEGKPTYALVTPEYFTNENPTYPYTVPEGEVWVMGDNRTRSNDSRVFGSVSVDAITGRAFFTYWPLSRFGVLK